ncbi:MAG TPA: GIY-YIG nuclease family protein [Bryobacteraceae bacterium]|nr:GIY-YIG nuclease family protein [Bryobacteraceae bacterium]
MDKREARQQFKAKKTPRGIFVIRCTASGQSWLGPSTHLDSGQNRAWFELRQGMHRNARMQAAWHAHGEAAFRYEILETFDEDLSPLLVKDTFAERLKHWSGELPDAERLDSWRS